MTITDETTRRAEFVAGLRAFADLLDTDPSIPTPTYTADIWAHIQEHGTGLNQDQRYAVVHDFADAHGVTVTEDHKGDRSARKLFGPVLLRVHAYADNKPAARTVTRPAPARTEPVAGDLIPA